MFQIIWYIYHYSASWLLLILTDNTSVLLLIGIVTFTCQYFFHHWLFKNTLISNVFQWKTRCCWFCVHMVWAGSATQETKSNWIYLERSIWTLWKVFLSHCFHFICKSHKSSLGLLHRTTYSSLFFSTTCHRGHRVSGTTCAYIYIYLLYFVSPKSYEATKSYQSWTWYSCLSGVWGQQKEVSSIERGEERR